MIACLCAFTMQPVPLAVPSLCDFQLVSPPRLPRPEFNHKPVALVGFREWVFSQDSGGWGRGADTSTRGAWVQAGNAAGCAPLPTSPLCPALLVGALAGFAASTEFTFGSIVQRVMTWPGSVRFHYGHPDLWNKLFIMTRGGVSKATRCGDGVHGARGPETLAAECTAGLHALQPAAASLTHHHHNVHVTCVPCRSAFHISEDVFAGYNHVQRSGNVKFKEYIRWGARWAWPAVQGREAFADTGLAPWASCGRTALEGSGACVCTRTGANLPVIALPLPLPPTRSVGKGRDMGFDSINSFESKVGDCSRAVRLCTEAASVWCSTRAKGSSPACLLRPQHHRPRLLRPPPLPACSPLPGVWRQRRAGDLARRAPPGHAVRLLPPDVLLPLGCARSCFGVCVCVVASLAA